MKMPRKRKRSTKYGKRMNKDAQFRSSVERVKEAMRLSRGDRLKIIRSISEWKAMEKFSAEMEAGDEG